MSDLASKQCFKCGEVKPLAEFYRHPQMADGHLNKCKECTKMDVARYRRGQGRERVLAYERQRARLPQRQRLARRVQRRLRRRHPERNRAYQALRRAVRAGVVSKPSRCENCGRDDVPLHGHHNDYGRALEVEWLCEHCHRTCRHQTTHLEVQMAEQRIKEDAGLWAEVSSDV